MSGNTHESRGRGGRPAVSEEAKCVFLDGLRAGMTHAEAARAAGYDRSTFFRARKRDAAFDAAWEDAISFSSGPRYICPGKGRQLQLRRNRRVAFTEKRREIFLDEFAGTCNLAASAEAAGVSEKTVLKHRATDPDFAARFDVALAQGYPRLEADIMRRRIEAQQKLKEIEPTGEPEPEFDRAMKLLQRWDRKDGSRGLRQVSPDHRRVWTFDEAMVTLDKKLRALGARSLPPPAGESGEGEDPALDGESQE